jgi:hypothetical protein
LERFLVLKKDTNTGIATEPTDEYLSKIEIVAVSMTRSESKTRNKETGRSEKPFVTTEAVNVLWIEWENSIAYRRAAGSVQKKHWEQLELEDLDLVLG